MTRKIRLLLAMMTVACMTTLMAQDIAGEYKLNGLYVVYHDIVRVDTDLLVSDIYGMGITIPISTMPEGYLFYNTYNGPHSEAALAAAGINLNVNFGEDGIAEIVEGSFYPDVNAVDCVTSVQVLPITDQMVYSSDLNSGVTVPDVDIIGIPTESSYAGQTSGSISLSTGFVLDYFPSTPTKVQIPSTYFIDLDDDGNIDIYVPANTDLPGWAGGFVFKQPGLTSISADNQAMGVYPDLYFEWHAVDGPVAESGLGEIVGEDEDGYTGDYDRIFGLPYVTATYMSAACGFNYPIVGDVSAVFEAIGLGACVEAVSVANDFYLMDSQFETWGNFLTYNAVVFSGTYSALIDAGMTPEDALNYIIANNPELLADDSGYDFDGVNGRLVMHFDPTCIPEYEARLVMVEFRDLNAGCAHNGDVDGDGNLTVTDIVMVVGEVLGTNPTPFDDEQFCNADTNSDGAITVLDIVQMVSWILNPGRTETASAVNIIKNGGVVSYEADGFVGGIELTLSHGENFSIDLTDNAMVADYKTDGYYTRILIIAPEGETLFTTEDNFTIETVLAASGTDYIDVNMMQPEGFSLSPAYPNPFNPITTLNLSLDVAGDVSMNVYNLNGQLVETLMNEYRDAGNYEVLWNASAAPSGIYFVKTAFNSQIVTQKLILLK